MKKSFFVKIFLPEGISLDQREVFSSLVLRLAQNFSFQGLDDWHVDLGAGEKVLGIESEFHDLTGKGKMSAEMRAHFALKTDAASFVKIMRASFEDLRVQGPYLLAPKDWMKEWRKHYKKQKIGAVTIVPAWLKSPAKGVSVRIYPGQAFGTGTHATTRLCLLSFLEVFKKDAGKFSCLDFGAGTGILAIAAAKLYGKGFKGDAVESDQVALDQARKNARLNRVSLRFLRKMPAKKKYDFIFANVLAPVLLAQKTFLKEAVSEGGHLVLSGILATEADAFLQEFGMDGFSLVRKSVEGDWAAILLKRD